MVRGMLRRMIGPSDEVQDLVQDVFLRLFDQLPTLRDPRALRSFIIGITVHVAGSELRRKRLRKWLRLSRNGALPERETGDNVGAREALGRLYEVLNQFDRRGRMAFVLRYFEGLQLTEVSEAMGCSLATTKRCLSRVSERFAAHVRRDPALAPYLRGKWAVSEKGEP